MKYFIYLIFLFSFSAFAEYETYLQVDESTEADKYFIMFMVSNSDVGNDSSLVNTSISSGGTVSLTKSNKLLPDRLYSFDISLKKEDFLFATVKLTISDKQKVIYKNQYKTRVTYIKGL